MKKKFNRTLKLLFILAFMGTALFTNATSIEVKDTIKQSTVWNVDTVRVTGDLYLPITVSLKIEPGTRVEFQGHYEFSFDGNIEAIGAPGDSIIFTINDTAGFHDLSKTNGAWKGLKLIKVHEASTSFEYCIFEFIKNLTYDYAIKLDGYEGSFSFNNIRNNYAKISTIYSNAFYQTIYKCSFQDNLCSALTAIEVSDCIITNNNGDGATLLFNEVSGEEGLGASLCINNKIENNKGFAIINSTNTYCQIQNNTIKNNYGGILICRSMFSQDIYNNIITNNNTHGAIIIDSSDVWMTGNVIYNNTVSTTNPLNQTGSVVSINTSKESKIFNNTIAYNHGINTGGLAVSNFESIEVNNNILWENTTISAASEAVFLSASPGPIPKLSLNSNLISNKSITFSPNIIIDSTFLISENPQFTEPENGVFFLSPTSPCINKGQKTINWKFYYTSKKDIANNYRVMSNIIDIGAYEFIPDSLLIMNLIKGNNVILCYKNYKSVYLRSNVYWDSYGEIEFNEAYHQWQKNGVNIKGAVYPDLLLENFTDNDLGNYRLLSKTYNSSEDTNSYFLTKTILGKVNYTYINVTEGSDTAIALIDITNDSVTYSWFKNGIKINDTISFLKFSNVNLSAEGYYYCKVSNECTTTITDSVFLDVIRPKRDTVLNTIACTKFEFGGKLITGPGIYYDTLLSAAGCDSIIQLNLQITDTLRSTINRTTCNSYDFNGKQLTKSGIYYDTLVTALGCNSIVTLNLTIQGITYKEFDTISCSDYTFKGKTYTKTGTYQHIETNEFGCITINTLNLLIPEIDPEVIVSESGTLTALSDTVVSWVRCDNDFASILNATTRTFKTDQSGSYAAIINNSGCIDTTACYNYSVSGFDNFSQNENILVYPNPFNLNTTISLGDPLAKIDEIRLINMIGEEVYRATDIKDNTYNLYRDKLVSGNYMLLIRSNNAIYNRRIMIE